MTIPVIITSAGPQPTDVNTIRTTLDADISATNPGYTSSLPGTLIEDILSTDVAAVAACDQSRVDAINSISPNAANLYFLAQLGSLRGIVQNSLTNTQAYVQFNGPAGTIIPAGFQVSDGTNTYQTVSSNNIGSSGYTNNQSLVVGIYQGSWNVPANSITTIVNQLSPNYTITCNNPAAGIAATTEGTDEYRARVLLAQNMAVQGTPSFIQSAIANVSGVMLRTISIQQYNNGYTVCVAGGDVNDIAAALYSGIGDISLLRASTTAVSGVSNTNPTVITTDIPHGLANGSTVYINGATGYYQINGTWTATVTGATTFTIPIDGTQYNQYSGGGFISPNTTLQTVTLLEGSDSYEVVFVIPTTANIGINVNWNATSSSSISASIFTSYALPAIMDYINTITTGGVINTETVKYEILNSLSGYVDITTITGLDIAVTINGVNTPPSVGEYIIPINSFSYPLVTSNDITFTQI